MSHAKRRPKWRIDRRLDGLAARLPYFNPYSRKRTCRRVREPMRIGRCDYHAAHNLWEIVPNRRAAGTGKSPCPWVWLRISEHNGRLRTCFVGLGDRARMPSHSHDEGRETRTRACFEIAFERTGASPTRRCTSAICIMDVVGAQRVVRPVLLNPQALARTPLPARAADGRPPETGDWDDWLRGENDRAIQLVHRLNERAD
jgi:hypothetical protein